MSTLIHQCTHSSTHVTQHTNQGLATSQYQIPIKTENTSAELVEHMLKHRYCVNVLASMSYNTMGKFHSHLQCHTYIHWCSRSIPLMAYAYLYKILMNDIHCTYYNTTCTYRSILLNEECTRVHCINDKRQCPRLHKPTEVKTYY